MLLFLARKKKLISIPRSTVKNAFKFVIKIKLPYAFAYTLDPHDKKKLRKNLFPRT